MNDPGSGRRRAASLTISVVVHGLLIFAVSHWRYWIDITPLRPTVINVRIAPGERLRLPARFELTGEGSTASGREVPETASAGPEKRQAEPGPAESGGETSASAAAESRGSERPMAAGPAWQSTLLPSAVDISALETPGLHDPVPGPSVGTGGTESPSPDLNRYLNRTLSDLMDRTSPAGKRSPSGSPVLRPVPYTETDLTGWAERVSILVQRNWLLDPSRDVDPRGLVEILATISRDGSVTSLRILTSAGQDVLDEAAVDALNRSGRLVGLPDDFPGQVLEVRFVFRYAYQ